MPAGENVKKGKQGFQEAPKKKPTPPTASIKPTAPELSDSEYSRLETLAEDMDYMVRMSLLRNPLTPSNIIAKMFDTGNCDEYYITKNPNTPSEILAEIIEPGIFDTEILLNISKNPNSSVETRQKVDGWLAEQGIISL